MFSGTISLPSLGFFTFPSGNGFTIGRKLVFTLRDGPRGFSQGFSCPAILRYRFESGLVFAYAAITLYCAVFQRARLTTRLGNSTVADPTTPAPPKVATVWLFRFPLRHYFGIEFLSFPPGTEMVHFPGFAVPDYGSSGPYYGFTVWVSHSDIPGSKLLAALRGFSQLATSFTLLPPRHPHAP